MTKPTLILLLLLVSSVGFASIDDDFEQLKNLGQDYEVSGVVCEQLARLDMIKTYPAPKFEVLTGIAYGDSDGTIGELDVIVFETKTREAVKVAEVKCWEDSAAALKKAHEQQTRLRSALRSPNDLFFVLTKDRRQFSEDQFSKIQSYEVIGPLGVKAAGFDRELAYSLRDLMELRSKLLQCHAKKECRARR